VPGGGDLFKIGLTIQALGNGLDLTNGGKKNGQKHGDYRYHDEQLY
jgi:hypothetical protein